MNYFDQLLESYSRLKKRNLVLLEAKKKPAKKTGEKSDKAKEDDKAREIDNAEALKLLELDFKAALEGRDDSTESGRAAEGAPYFWKAPATQTAVKKGIWNGQGEPPLLVKVIFKEQQAQGTDVKQLKQFYERVYNMLINYYMGDLSDNMQATLDGANLVAIQNIPGAKIQQKVLEILGDAAEITESEQNAIERIKIEMTLLLARAEPMSKLARDSGEETYFAGWQKKEATGKTPASEDWTALGSWESFVVGDANMSISRAVREGSTARLDPQTGLDFIPIARDPDFMARALASVNALTALASANVPDDIRALCLDLAQKVQRRGKRLVFLTGPNTEGQVEGLVMPENGMLSFAVKTAEGDGRCGKTIREVSREFSPNELNSIRGPAFETGIVGASIFESLIHETDENLKEEIYQDLVKWMSEELFDDAKKFSASMVKLRRFRDLEAAEDVQGADLTDLFFAFNDQYGDTPEKFRAFMELVTGLREAQEKALQMDADMSFSVAKEKGIGYSDDVIHLYLDKTKAEAGIKKLNLEDGSEPHPLTLGELKEKDTKQAQLFAKRFKVTDDSTPIYGVGEGVKSYMNPTEVKVGETGRQQRRSDIVLTAGTVPDEDLKEYNPGTAQVIWKRLWGSTQADQAAGLESARRYQKDALDHIFNTVNDLLPADTTVFKDDDGNILDLNYDTFMSIIDHKVDGLAFNSTTKATMRSIFEGKDLTDRTTRLKTREEISRLLMNVRQYGDLHSENVQTRLNARNNLAYTVQLLGGVKNDSSITVLGLDNKSILVTSHMRIINKYTKGLLSGDGSIEPQLGGDGFSIKLNNTTGSGSVSLSCLLYTSDAADE